MDKFLRVAFLLILTGPTAYYLDTRWLPVPLAVPSLLLYLIPYSDLCEQNGGRTTLYSRRWPVWNWFIRRFNLKVRKSSPLPPNKSYLFGCHPHGILPFACVIGLSNELPGSSFQAVFPDITLRTLAATFCFYVPLYRDMLLWGGVVDAAKYSAMKVLNMGYSLAVFPGGAREALYARPHKDVIYIRKRLGFIRLAMQTGTSLVPVFTFVRAMLGRAGGNGEQNENNAYHVAGIDSPFINKCKEKFQAIFGISLPLVLNLIPRKSNTVVLVGAPIEVPHIAEPTTAELEATLGVYMAALEKLYNDNREKYNEPKDKPPLEMV